MPKEKIRHLMNFLRYYTVFKNESNKFAFEQELNHITNNHTTMGIEELIIHRAEQRGKIEGKAEGEKNMLRETAKAMKTYNYPITEIIKITKLSAEEVEKL
ncbi:hypothetical protein [Pedobacter sp. GR22-6]|uniref:hypothetical protein n=1 Tax=Pedobacter sp. GR22-6 TaxID=3127957 RepID=UPI00307E5BFE